MLSMNEEFCSLFFHPDYLIIITLAAHKKWMMFEDDAFFLNKKGEPLI